MTIRVSYERGKGGVIYPIEGVTSYETIDGMLVVEHVVSTMDGVEHRRRTRIPEHLLVCIEEDA